ncbi:MFS transporter [Caldibacillus debilis]|uniref:Major facilitator superfamily (MFS) profile domain-containing protein n=1 Tax=Caldibacillus debilis TaxID=301148 RepID=A0A150MC35_9BACI|nr:MFS transporter [Caldibacillus debilis]KYD21968.1 hypothetical protein B4135_1594 [Caldibacillus debilis]
MANPLRETSVPLNTVYGILFAISAGHLINDTAQSVVPALFPILQDTLHLSYFQIGLMTFMLNMTSSVMQPVFGYIADKRPAPFFLPAGMLMSTAGLAGLALAQNYALLLLAVLLIGLGSALFHPEGSRVAYMAAGSRRGLSQSIYQVGGNLGQALFPLFTYYLFVPFGQRAALLFTLLTCLGMAVLFHVSKWYQLRLRQMPPAKKTGEKGKTKNFRLEKKVKAALILLVLFVFARSWYHAGISNFYQFYLIHDYGLTVKEAQVYLLVFMISGVLGTFFGGPLADRFGRKNILAFSMLGAAPFAVLLPYLPLFLVIPFFAMTGFIIMSSFSVAVVYAQELIPNQVGVASGLIVGLAFGMGAIGSVLLGSLADFTSIRTVMILCSFLPAVGTLALALPDDEAVKQFYAQEK